MMTKKTPVYKTLAENRKARHDYFILETLEAGIALEGTEVKAARAGKANLQDSFVRIENNEAFLYHLHIGPYAPAGQFNHDPLRIRKLLLNRAEIRWLTGKVREKGLTLIPLRLYLNPRGLVKVELALAQGKRSYDKRQEIARRDAQREIARTLRSRQKF